MKSLANDTIRLQKKQIVLMVVVAILASLGILLHGIIYHRINEIINACLILTLTLSYYKIMQKTIFQLADEVWDTGYSLIIKKQKLQTEIPYYQIRSVKCLFKYIISLKNPCIEVTFRHPTNIGKQILFITWADNINYQTEFKILPHKNPETLKWVASINKKINSYN